METRIACDFPLSTAQHTEPPINCSARPLCRSSSSQASSTGIPCNWHIRTYTRHRIRAVATVDLQDSSSNLSTAMSVRALGSSAYRRSRGLAAYPSALLTSACLTGFFLLLLLRKEGKLGSYSSTSGLSASYQAAAAANITLFRNRWVALFRSVLVGCW